jgi:hypothetical protein
MLCKMLTGQGFRANTPAFVAKFRAACVAMCMMALVATVHAEMPGAAPRKTEIHVMTMPDCAGVGARATLTMDSDYMGNFPGCLFGVTLAPSGCTATLTIPSADCVPSTGTVTMATIVVRTQFNQVHAIFVVRAVDGVVIVDQIDF